MNDKTEVSIVRIGDWQIRWRQPPGGGPFPIVLLLHGWTGDENVMWVFTSRLPRGTLLLAPRAPYPTPLGGFGWHPYKAKAWPWVEDFRPAIQALSALISQENFPTGDVTRLHLMGFSQGAALAYSFLLLYPERISSVTSLSGFLPDGAEHLPVDPALHAKPVFIAHGALDDLVPVDRARKAVELFEKAGARVTYCEDEVGHKLSVNCFRSLEAFQRGL
jgi:phospholipase/carboxylesterase